MSPSLYDAAATFCSFMPNLLPIMAAPASPIPGHARALPKLTIGWP